MASDNLPEKKDPLNQQVAVYQPPASFEVVDRGPATPVTFEAHGDTFVGIYDYREYVETDDVDKATGEKKMIAMDVFTGADGQAYCIFPGWHLSKALNRVDAKSWVRITYTADMDTGKPSPMKVFTVEVGR